MFESEIVLHRAFNRVEQMRKECFEKNQYLTLEFTNSNVGWREGQQWACEEMILCQDGLLEWFDIPSSADRL